MKYTGKKTAYYFCLMIFLLLSIGGCGLSGPSPAPAPPQDFKAQNEELKKLLPNRMGFRWVYSGFVEYGHIMELKSISSTEQESVYNITGLVDDPSGGEAKGDFSLTVNYIIKNAVLTQRKQAEKIMDNFDELQLIKTPLQAQTQWEQRAKHKDGKEYDLVCTIMEVKEEAGGRVYTVMYKDQNSPFYEKRRIKENMGIVAFETVWFSKEGPVTMGYELYEEASGYAQQVTFREYLPPLNKQLRYFGLAEYAHIGEMIRIKEDSGEAIYQFNGEFQDGSGIPGSFKVQYIVNYQEGTVLEKVIENTRAKKNEVNSKLHDPIILKLPLEAGHTWQQEIQVEGQKRLMTATIVNIGFEGQTYYSQIKSGQPILAVRYLVEDVPGYFQNIYVEERRFQKGWGMIGYSHLMKGDLGLASKTDEYRIEQAIINNMFGYSIARE